MDLLQTVFFREKKSPIFQDLTYISKHYSVRGAKVQTVTKHLKKNRLLEIILSNLPAQSTVNQSRLPRTDTPKPAWATCSTV